MGKQRSGWVNLLLNIALVIFGLSVMVLLYGFVTRVFVPRSDPARESNPAGLVGDIIQVEVRNGCGVAGLAAEMTLYLRRQGFDVVEMGDYSTFDLERSMVVDRVGNLDAARKVAASLGLSEENVKQELRPDYYLDASVVIGKDYASLKPFEKEEE